MKIFDSHIHYYMYENYDLLWTDIVSSNHDYKYIAVSVDLDSYYQNIEIIKKYPNGYLTLGFHPSYVDDSTLAEVDKFNTLLDNVVAIGEIGLDKTYQIPLPLQIEALKKQLEFAIKYNLPVIIHSRDAFVETYEILKEYKGYKILMHCFGYGSDEVKKFIELGFYISFAGNVTYKKAINLRSAAEIVPIDKIMVETDGPFLSPQSKRGSKENNPLNIIETASLLASIHQMSLEKFLETTYNNAKEFFNV